MLTRRLDLGLLQKEVADRLDIEICNVRNWERNKTSPEVRFIPGILDFLGYDPTAGGTSFAEALRHARRAAGLSQRALCRETGFDQSSIALWERGHKLPLPANLDRLRSFFAGAGQGLPGFEAEAAYGAALRAEAARSAWRTRRAKG